MTGATAVPHQRRYGLTPCGAGIMISICKTPRNAKGNDMKKATFGLLLLTTLSFGLTACHTMAGAGQDIEDAGQGIHKSADKHAPDDDQ